MLKLTFSAVVIAITAIVFTAVVHADDPSYLVSKQKFAGITPADAVAMGYVTNGVCIDAADLPPPVLEILGIPSTAAMGIHYAKDGTFDNVVHGSEPEVLVFGPDGTLWSIEFESDDTTENITVLGQEMPFHADGHPGMEFGHYAMHAWMIPNPAGQFFDWNPAVTCEGAASITPPATGSGGLISDGGASGSSLVTALMSVSVLITMFAGLRLLKGRQTL